MHPLEESVRQFVIETFLFGVDDGRLGVDDSFIEKGLIDSIGILTLISHVEEKFGIRVDDDELTPDNWDSISRIVNYVAIKQARACATVPSAARDLGPAS